MEWTNEASEEWTETGRVVHTLEYAKGRSDGRKDALRQVRDEIRNNMKYASSLETLGLGLTESEGLRALLEKFDKGGIFEIEEGPE